MHKGAYSKGNPYILILVLTAGLLAVVGIALAAGTDTFTEEFEDQTNMDAAATTALWDDTNDPGVLTGLLEYGDGSDGTLDFSSGDVTIDTDVQDVWNLTSLVVPHGRTLILLGSKPAIFRVQRDVCVKGTIDVSGRDGEPPVFYDLWSDPQSGDGAAGGRGGAGGGGGGGGATQITAGGRISLEGCGTILANGGDGGSTIPYSPYNPVWYRYTYTSVSYEYIYESYYGGYPGAGGAGAGGSVHRRAADGFDLHGRIDVSGGKGGSGRYNEYVPNGYPYYDHVGGDAGDGRIVLESPAGVSLTDAADLRGCLTVEESSSIDGGSGTTDWAVTSNTTVDTDTGSGAPSGVYSAGVFTVDDFSVASGVTLTVTGSLPFHLYAAGDIDVSGTVDGAGADGGDLTSTGYYSSPTGFRPYKHVYGGAGGPGGGDGAAEPGGDGPIRFFYSGQMRAPAPGDGGEAVLANGKVDEGTITGGGGGGGGGSSGGYKYSYEYLNTLGTVTYTYKYYYSRATGVAGGGGGNVCLKAVGGLDLDGVIDARGGPGGRAYYEYTATNYDYGTNIYSYGGDGGRGAITLIHGPGADPDLVNGAGLEAGANGTIHTGTYVPTDTAVSTWQDTGAMVEAALEYLEASLDGGPAELYLQAAPDDSGSPDVSQATVWVASDGDLSVLDENRWFRFKVVLELEDGGYPVVDSVSVTWQYDAEPPTFDELSVSPSELWPPNNKMMEIEVTAVVSDNVDPDPHVEIVSVTCNEDCEGDYEITGDLTLNLRAERDGEGTGRIYTIHLEATDFVGNTSTATVEVTVPHDQGGGNDE